MHHGTNIALINPKTKGNRGTKYGDFAREKRFLNLFAFFGQLSSMVAFDLPITDSSKITSNFIGIRLSHEEVFLT